jgi:two-component system sensor histidine kinase KdpD
VICAVVAVGASAFFFYPPIYDFRVYNPIHLVDIVLFIFVAIVTGKLATDVREAKMRERADALRETLIDSVSHELRTPLATIIGSASVLAQAPEFAKSETFGPLVRGLEIEATRLNHHIQNLLDATRIKTEGIKPRKEWVDPGDVVNAAVAHRASVLAEHDVNIVVSDNIPLVEVDPTLIERALGHLIENAVKYSPLGSTITITAQQHEHSIVVAVADQGVGLAEHEHPKIWDRFYRSPRHDQSIAGSGLGLWIAQALVDATEGTIGASSAGIGKGATFTITLPITGGGRIPDEDSDE